MTANNAHQRRQNRLRTIRLAVMSPEQNAIWEQKALKIIESATIEEVRRDLAAELGLDRIRPVVESQERLQDRTGDPSCVHHWLLPSPEGPTIDGVCKHCGAHKAFSSTCTERKWQARGAAKLPPIVLRRL